MVRFRWFMVVAVMSVMLGMVGARELPAQDTDAEFRPLFNGRDLSGWVLVNTPPETWSVQDGMLICTGKPIGELRTERMYQNFILEVEWRHMVPKGNAGIFVWADDITSRGVPFHRGVEVQVLENAYGNTQSHTTHGDIFPIHGASMTPVNGRGGGSRAFPTQQRAKSSPEWNHYRIEGRDGAISLAVNGEVVTRGTDAVPRKGYICLESEGGVVHYRNLRIRELPETALDPAHVAIAARGFRSIYTGLNLNGWTVSGDSGKSWQPNDWVLEFRDDGSEGTSKLTSEESFGNVGFIFDLRPSEKFTSLSLQLAGAAEPLQISATDPRWKELFGQRNQWQRWEGELHNGMLRLAVNGKTVIDAQPWPTASGPFRFSPRGSADFANIYVRTLKP